MNRTHILIQGVWAVLVVGAYVTGTNHRPPPPSTPRLSLPMAPMGDVPCASAGETNSTGADWLRSYQAAGGTISPERMKEAVRDALRDPDPVRATLYFAHLLEKLTPENALAALRAIQQNSHGADAVRFMGLLAHAWGTLDGPAALAELQSLNRRDLDGATSAAMAAWASRNPEAARSWMVKRGELANIPGDVSAEQALTQGLVGGMARHNLQEALNYVMTFDEERRAKFAHLLAEQKMKEGVTKGAEWALSLPEEGMRTNALETVGYQYIREDMEGARQWAEKIAARSDAHEAVADVANELANRNGLEAAVWATQLPAGESQNHALEDVYETWTRADPFAASQSLNGMEPGAARDSAIQAFSRTLAKENPVDAVTWAGAISDDRERINVQVDIARRWHAAAPTDAKEWITANLPAEAQARAMTPRR